MVKEKPSVLDAFTRITSNSDLTSVDLLTILRNLYHTGYECGLRTKVAKLQRKGQLPLPDKE